VISSGVNNVIFDVGGVLLDWNPGRILEGYYADPAERGAMQQAIFLHADWLELDRGTLAESALLARIAERAGRPVPELATLFEVVRDSLQPKMDTVALLHALAARRVPLYCLSNMPARTYAYLRERFDFWRCFTGIVISGEVRMVKPQPEIFAYLLQRHGLVAADSVFIDDHGPNVDAARAQGLHAVQFRDAGQCAAALQEFLGGR
jgi:HAD superfamily hydrolase (TIGR01509 family)